MFLSFAWIFILMLAGQVLLLMFFWNHLWKNRAYIFEKHDTISSYASDPGTLPNQWVMITTMSAGFGLCGLILEELNSYSRPLTHLEYVHGILQVTAALSIPLVGIFHSSGKPPTKKSVFRCMFQSDSVFSKFFSPLAAPPSSSDDGNINQHRSPFRRLLKPCATPSLLSNTPASREDQHPTTPCPILNVIGSCHHSCVLSHLKDESHVVRYDHQSTDPQFQMDIFYSETIHTYAAIYFLLVFVITNVQWAWLHRWYHLFGLLVFNLLTLLGWFGLQGYIWIKQKQNTAQSLSQRCKPREMFFKHQQAFTASFILELIIGVMTIFNTGLCSFVRNQWLQWF